MLARHTAFYFLANAFSAVFGLVNVVVFTRLFAAEAFGDYLLGFAFATFFATFLSSAIKLAILRDQARGDGTDVRPAALAALLLCALASPLGYLAARLANLAPAVAAASIGLTLAIVVYDTSQELLRAEQKAASFMRGTVARAVLVSALGIASTQFGRTGALLLASASVAFLLATLSFWRIAWGAARPRFDAARLFEILSSGFPLTISLSLLALSGMTDRFLLANLAGVGAAGQFGASLDIVRQSLAIPAISIATAFVPMAVRLLASAGAPDARAHLAKYLEILLAATLPACVGLAIVAPQVADLVLGSSFREVSRASMPVFAAALLFQILTLQYLHTSFLLSNRTGFYLVNTGSIIAWNLVASYLLISRFGVMGAVWGRLATEVFGFLNALLLSRWAFAMPFPLRRIAPIVAAAATMGAVVAILEKFAGAHGPAALVVLVPAGVAVYAAAIWLLDVGDVRAVSRRLAPKLLQRSRALLDRGARRAAAKLAETRR
ncbi:MAG: polysaccharide biosynthesis C-terminal domain-containing protein [Roseiarcus sp.]|jgi:O-antigen/teichoic acid export membrane protein